MPDIFTSGSSLPQPVSVPVPAPAAFPGLRAPRSRFLRSFQHFPRNLHFDTQDKKENVVLLLRQHPIVILPWLLFTLLLLFVPVFAPLFFTGEILPFSYRLIAVIFWYFFVFAYFFEHSLRWYYNVLIVTDQRLIDVDFPSLLYREMTEARLDHVEEVSSRKGGYLRSLFDFGDVLVQTAGAIPEIEIKDVPDPEYVTKIIYDLIKKGENAKTK
ncbi:MAG: PH domain-containing protein [Candidatus Shapirobacteria bacterium]